VVVFGKGGLEIGCGDIVWASLVSTPLHEEAIAQAQHHCENRHSVVVAHPASVPAKICASYAMIPNRSIPTPVCAAITLADFEGSTRARLSQTNYA
jgi:hypothetical protein